MIAGVQGGAEALQGWCRVWAPRRDHGGGSPALDDCDRGEWFGALVRKRKIRPTACCEALIKLAETATIDAVKIKVLGGDGTTPGGKWRTGWSTDGHYRSQGVKISVLAVPQRAVLTIDTENEHGWVYVRVSGGGSVQCAPHGDDGGNAVAGPGRSLDPIA